jgi:hypothetical protein
MKSSRLIAAPIILLTTAGAPAHESNDYPTHERVAYVFECMKEQGGMNYTNLYRCSCSIDYIASKLSYEDFVILDTFVRGQNAAGERSEILREGELAEDSRDTFEEIEAEAAQHCALPMRAGAEGEEGEEGEE